MKPRAVRPIRIAWTGATAVAVGVMFALPSAAAGATVSTDVPSDEAYEDCQECYQDEEVTVTFIAAAGEANRLSVSLADEKFLLTDTGARVVATGDCKQAGRHAAECPWRWEFDVDFKIRLGDRNDKVALSFGWAYQARIAGGKGADVLRGGAGPDSIDGGGGVDRLYGGGGDDRLVDGDTAGDRDGDRFDGGADDADDWSPGYRFLGDTVTYAKRRRGVVVDLAAGVAPREGDTYTNLETVLGGRGNDRLIGTDGENSLQGGNGNDILRGGGGGDALIGGFGRDKLHGGADDDDLRADHIDDIGADIDDIDADSVSCGSGDDATRQRVRDVLARDCERASVEPGLFFVPHPTIEGRRLSFTVTCLPSVNDYCSGSLALELPSSRSNLATKEFRLEEGRAAEVDLTLSRKAAERLGSARIVRVRVKTRDYGKPKQDGYSFRPRAASTVPRPSRTQEGTQHDRSSNAGHLRPYNLMADEPPPVRDWFAEYASALRRDRCGGVGAHRSAHSR